jgi:hypothetical protein
MSHRGNGRYPWNRARCHRAPTAARSQVIARPGRWVRRNTASASGRPARCGTPRRQKCRNWIVEWDSNALYAAISGRGGTRALRHSRRSDALCLQVVRVHVAGCDRHMSAMCAARIGLKDSPCRSTRKTRRHQGQGIRTPTTVDPLRASARAGRGAASCAGASSTWARSAEGPSAAGAGERHAPATT